MTVVESVPTTPHFLSFQLTCPPLCSAYRSVDPQLAALISAWPGMPDKFYSAIIELATKPE